MVKLDYHQIYLKLTKDLPERVKEVLARRFGIGKEKPETLESIGKSFKITRERVRQIQERAFLHIKRENREILEKIYNDFVDYFSQHGGLKKEELTLSHLGEENFKNHVLFFLTLGDPFFKHFEKPDYFSFWGLKKFSYDEIKNLLTLISKELEKEGKPIPKDFFFSSISSRYKIETPFLSSLIEVSKTIDFSPDGSYCGLKKWPEIFPKTLKDKAYFILKKEGRPLHFKEISSRIGPSVLVPSLHNELIRSDKFVLVGRGIYGLREWGYIPGTVKDLIFHILKENKEGLTKEEIIEKVKAQRMVERETILSVLYNKNYFQKDKDGKYKIV